jgi:peptidoglycan/xylan/chitin deacetylase (PgdA/CDA1 family)
VSKQKRLAALLALFLVLAGGGYVLYRLLRTPYRAGARTGQLPVLVYHCIAVPPGRQDTSKQKDFDYLYVDPEAFDKQLAWLAGEGYRFLTPREALTWRPGEKAVLITFDDGYKDNYTAAFPILQKYNAKAAIFMVASKLGFDKRLTAEELREMEASGVWTIGSHGYHHQDFRQLTAAELEENLSLSKEILEELAAAPVNAVAYPQGGCDERVMAAAARYYEMGFIALAEREEGQASTVMNLPREGVYSYTAMREFRALMRQFFP